MVQLIGILRFCFNNHLHRQWYADELEPSSIYFCFKTKTTWLKQYVGPFKISTVCFLVPRSQMFHPVRTANSGLSTRGFGLLYIVKSVQLILILQNFSFILNLFYFLLVGASMERDEHLAIAFDDSKWR
jgi:hypothetical protein